MADQGDLFGPETYKDSGRYALKVLRDRAIVCQKCKLHETRKNVVFGVGNFERPRICFVGEAPGENEDIKGEPFVGKAGQLLDKMIVAMGFTREQLYIVNVVGCRPPGNRPPEPDEVAACKEHIVGQLRLIQPQMIVTLGASATKALLKSQKAIGELRGRWYEWEGIPLRATYHPSFLLRSPHKKKDAWSDLQIVLQKLAATDSYGQGQGDGHGHGNEATDSSHGNGRDGSSPPVPEGEGAGRAGDPEAVRSSTEAATRTEWQPPPEKEDGTGF